MLNNIIDLGEKMNYKNLLNSTSFSKLISNLAGSFVECLNDDFGSLFFNLKPDHLNYMNLSINKSIKSIFKNDLPQEFCDNACSEIDIFRRKTFNEINEWMIYLDFENGEILDCFKGVNGEVIGQILESRYKGRKVVAIHNHPEGYLSPPSYDNFGILKFAFQDYEIICSKDEFWILEAKGVVKNRELKIIKRNVKLLYKHAFDFSEDNQSLNRIYEENLLNYLNNKNNIKLIKKEYK